MPEKDWFTLDKVGECVSVCVCVRTRAKGGVDLLLEKM